MRMWSGCVGRCYLDWPPASPRWWSVGTASHRQRNLGLDTHLGTVQYLAMDTTDPSFDRQPTPEPVEDDEEPERPPFFGSPAHGGAGNPELRRRLSQLSSPTPAPLAKRTRTMDLSTFARDQANKVRLPGDLQKRSVEYAQADQEEQPVLQHIATLELIDRTRRLEEAPGKLAVEGYKLSKVAKTFLIDQGYEVVMDASANSYKVDATNKALTARLEATKTCNFDNLMKDPTARAEIDSNIGSVVSQAKNKIKTLLNLNLSRDPDHLGADIYVLCVQVNELSSERKKAKKQPTVQMLARFAFLRYCHERSRDLNIGVYEHWDFVTKQLEDLRMKKGDDPAAISAWLRDKLKQDESTWGAIDIQKIHIDSSALLA
ncbi:hypothetical protein PENSPDRAFT_652145 [Peniophora sp. CONT]|nr:hypothetical protein PENSPDRAFT_652145 [Peniophora sp. CONT]